MPIGPRPFRPTGLSLLAALLLSACAGAATPPPAPGAFLVGADISALPTHENHGAMYLENGHPMDAVALLRRHGFNAFRLRLFVHPNHEGIVDNDLSYTLALARRVRASGARFLLDLHYSDTWADPSRQSKPASWASLPFTELVRRVRTYTRDTLARFAAEGVTPDYVQIGNEITNGMLWPDGRVDFSKSGDSAAWDRLAQLLKAGADGIDEALPAGKRPAILLHIESVGNLPRTKWWIGNLLSHHVPFDLIGFSYYPEWHGSLTDLRAALDWTATATGRPVLVAETAYPWHPDAHFANIAGRLAFPVTPAGQRSFLDALAATVRAVPGGRGAGVFYWYPEAVPTPDLFVWLGGACALFDQHGELLPAASFARDLR
ncbi:arabinogalactan endo-1,4-beta-galactosidase precursor [mine drainage metagenome]|uniref:arabinogalactan endo-beta-1,4-galactanase n=1 Tax=mine drainage metagenome TaxID=410659 RepID=A0A1J5TDD8_9ZZZZ